jgi:hypothetical protein
MSGNIIPVLYILKHTTALNFGIPKGDQIVRQK